ncbi:hypothetical protein [Mucilaginibacter sp. NFX135]
MKAHTSALILPKVVSVLCSKPPKKAGMIGVDFELLTYSCLVCE